MGDANLTFYAMWDSANFTLDQATPFSVRVNWRDELAASNLQFKIVKAAAAASIDTYAEADAVTGTDILLDWTSGIGNASVWLRSNTTTFINVIAKGGSLTMCYTPQSQATPEVHFPNILGLSSGDLLVVYKDASDGNKGKTLVYDKNGNYKTGPTTVVNALDAGWDDHFALIPLSTGGAAMGFTDGGDINIGVPNYIKLDTNGAAVGSKQALAVSNKTYLGPEIAETGGKMFAYYSADSKITEDQGSRYSIYNVSDNSAVVDNTLLNAGGGNVECRGVAVSPVGSAQKFFVMDSRGWATLVPRYRIFDSAGNIVKAETAFATTKSETFSPVLLANGNVMVTYKDLNDGNKGKFAVYNDSGDLVVGATVFADTDVASWRLPTALTDAGDVFIAFTDSSDASKSKYTIVKADGTVTVSATALDGGIAYPLGATNVATENKMAIVYRHKDDTSYWLGFLNGF
ncbi:hypothetical protein KBA41_09540 [Candidatus Ozemobacteraceae bacterium]|nr:hypothetical protein [Candidatus Ozemobacteraceae bacterium]